jgi:cytochrome c553
MNAVHQLPHRVPRNWRVHVWAIACALVLPGLAHAAEPPVRRVPDTIAQRTLACTVCHGQQGRATNAGYFPRIAGKPAAYLYNQLVNFREGRRTYAAMTHLVDHLSDAYLQEIADYFAGLNLPYPAPQTVDAPAPVLARGEALVRHGDVQRKIAACMQCHCAAMTGVAPAFPGLLGLPRDYLVAQLGAWQDHKRRAVAPDCMAQIATQLSVDDVSAIATWLSAQALPANTHAVAATAARLPLECGSGVH